MIRYSCKVFRASARHLVPRTSCQCEGNLHTRIRPSQHNKRQGGPCSTYSPLCSPRMTRILKSIIRGNGANWPTLTFFHLRSSQALINFDVRFTLHPD
ncbi:hypothetical protein PISMIDRAFT_454173 [Pisolithus microcarpus 441]|uniref:Uncharacterized protein n=1 Tax=Pisolithus microcarpus 441 TaxID=765257 RepID=A0A0C9ZV46_9AGAM|nr:hypothetical protein PISMIDRAFT_454173 [Pisolithus microcarpus 441]